MPRTIPTIYTTRIRPLDFVDMPADFEVHNAPRPLYGSHVTTDNAFGPFAPLEMATVAKTRFVANGDFFRGVYYAAIDPADEYADEWREQNARLDAARLVFVTPDHIAQATRSTEDGQNRAAQAEALEWNTAKIDRYFVDQYFALVSRTNDADALNDHPVSVALRELTGDRHVDDFATLEPDAA